MSDSLRTFIEKTAVAETPEELFVLFDTFVGAYGIDVSSYHITAERLRAVPLEMGLIRETFPQEWVAKYIRREYADIDPVIAQARLEVEPFHWFDVADKVKLSKQQTEFLGELKRAGLTDGIAVPIFGPKGTIAYFGLGCCNDKVNLTPERMTELQFACQRTHNLYVEMTPVIHDDGPPPKLSKRETEVLGLIATGMSNNNVADRLGVTENTIDTMLRRAFRKLGVNNRISAVLKGIGAGLILP